MPVYEVEINGRTFEVDARNQTVAVHMAATFSHANPPDAATRGMLAPDTPASLAQADDDRWSNLEGRAGEGGGYHPTGAQTAAGLVGLAAGGALAANPGAIPAAARAAWPVVKPVAKWLGVGGGLDVGGKIANTLYERMMKGNK